MIAPRRVEGALLRVVVAAVAVAKHHTAALSAGGDLFTWGSNRDGRLGYPAPDTQTTPRRCGAFFFALAFKIQGQLGVNAHMPVWAAPS